jgi:molybdopterin-guanine dinucleotide biosynthesis protein A
MVGDTESEAARSFVGVGAVVLAGGAGTRLGGVDKPGLAIAGTTLLDRALTAVSDAEPVVVVGPHRPTGRPVRWTREDPPGCGPLAAVAAGLAALSTGPAAPDRVVLLAADLVGLWPDTVRRLLAALAADPGADGALLTDDTGHPQWLTGVWRLAALRAAMPADPAGGSLRSVLSGLTAVRLPARAGETADIDTPADLAAARDQPPPAGG